MDVLKVADVLAIIAGLDVVERVAVVVVAEVVAAVLAPVTGDVVVEYGLAQSFQAWWQSPPVAFVLDWR